MQQTNRVEIEKNLELEMAELSTLWRWCLELLLNSCKPRPPRHYHVSHCPPSYLPPAKTHTKNSRTPIIKTNLQVVASSFFYTSRKPQPPPCPLFSMPSPILTTFIFSTTIPLSPTSFFPSPLLFIHHSPLPSCFITSLTHLLLLMLALFYLSRYVYFISFPQQSNCLSGQKERFLMLEVSWLMLVMNWSF